MQDVLIKDKSRGGKVKEQAETSWKWRIVLGRAREPCKDIEHTGRKGDRKVWRHEKTNLTVASFCLRLFLASGYICKCLLPDVQTLTSWVSSLTNDVNCRASNESECELHMSSKILVTETSSTAKSSHTCKYWTQKARNFMIRFLPTYTIWKELAVWS